MSLLNPTHLQPDFQQTHAPPCCLPLLRQLSLQLLDACSACPAGGSAQQHGTRARAKQAGSTTEHAL